MVELVGALFFSPHFLFELSFFRAVYISYQSYRTKQTNQQEIILTDVDHCHAHNHCHPHYRHDLSWSSQLLFNKIDQFYWQQDESRMSLTWRARIIVQTS
jgi:hypothetical protein